MSFLKMITAEKAFEKKAAVPVMFEHLLVDINKCLMQTGKRVKHHLK